MGAHSCRPRCHLVRPSVMDEFAVRCPRCKRTFTGDEREQLADTLIEHLAQEHGHSPPRDHVVARVGTVDQATGSAT